MGALDKNIKQEVPCKAVKHKMTPEEIEQEVLSLCKAVEHRMTPEDINRIKTAYAFAYKAHDTQERSNGDPFIIHPVTVARIVAEELQLGVNSIIAAFLHDVVEDTPCTVEDIRNEFGDDVAFLVRVVTKKKKEHYEMSKQLDNFKQILDSVNYDIRALLIKLADRLHNMRTLSSLHGNKQMKIASETDYFYAPLANRLGLYEIKTELYNLGLRYRCPQEYAELEESLDNEKREKSGKLRTFTNMVSGILLKNNIPARMEVKYRTPYSIWRKMKDQKINFNRLTDKAVIWVIFPDDIGVSDKSMCLRIYSLLTDVFKEKHGSVVNYIDTPKENGYQSFHIKLNIEGGWEDVHISSERMIRNSRLGCVAERTDSNLENWINKFRSVLRDISLYIKEEGYIENVLYNFYNDDIVVFTPKGDGVIMPKQATALDFAYEIHTSVGKKARYAHINGKLCSIKTVLQRGDCVEIGIDENAFPKPDWLDHVLTYKAKHNLQALLKDVKTIPYKRCPDCDPLPGDELIGFLSEDKKTTYIHKRNCIKARKYAAHNGDSIVEVKFEEDKDILYPVRVKIKAVDRYHLLTDMTACIIEKLKLSISGLTVISEDEIVDCTIDFSVHSAKELQEFFSYIHSVEGIDEAYRQESY